MGYQPLPQKPRYEGPPRESSMGTPPIPLARPRPDPVMQVYQDEMQCIRDYVNNYSPVNWDLVSSLLKDAEHLRKAATGEWEQPLGRPRESIDSSAFEYLRNAVISPDEARAKWGIPTQQAANALARVFGLAAQDEAATSPQEVGCVGYEEL